MREEGRIEIDSINNEAAKEKKDLLDQCFDSFEFLNLVNCCINFHLGWLEALKSPFDQ